MRKSFCSSFLVTLAVCCLLHGSVESALQCLTVRGRAKCGLGETPTESSPIFIKLVDRDTARVDDDMDETYAGRYSGAFQLWGCATDPLGSNIDPELRIYHKCKGRDRMVTIVIPEAAIGKEYNITDVINLQGNFQKDVEKTFPVPKCTSRIA
uniref:Transthyretin-like protein 46 n=1 Tax=Romanomermis culicivorax TaxID=13658 RepID=A0A915JUK7_ROMCU